MGKLKKGLTIVAFSLGGLAIITAGLAAYTSRSSFCVTCHYMQPFYDSWRQSTHNKVECIECHFAPGLKGAVAGKLNGLVQLVKYTSLTYKKSRPWAEISDESCLRTGCHETRLLKGRVNYKEGVVFDHAPHLGELKRGKKLRCTSCHSQIVQGKHITVTETACYLCHFKTEDGGIVPKQGECTVCHVRDVMERRSKAGELRYDHSIVLREKLACQTCHSHTVMGNGPVAKQNCFACHWDNERLGQFNNTDLMHTKHISENKIECQRCHLAIEHKLRPGDIKTAAECQTCHPLHHNATITLFSGEGASGVPSMPNRMFQVGLNCRGCHISHGLTVAGEKAPGTYYASGKSCDTCHGRGFSKLIKTWQREARERVAVLEKAAAKLGNAADKGTKEKLAALRENLAIVARGNIVHNVRYASEILETARNTLAGLGKQAKIPLVLPPAGIKEREPNADCLTCHFYLNKVAPMYAGMAFNHKTHNGKGFECQRCHSIAVKHAELIVDKDGCASCHHSKKIAKKCEECHTLQNDIIQGRWNVIDEPSMKSLDFPCTKCHQMNGKAVTPEDCAACHKNPAYAEKMNKWVKDVDTQVGDLNAGIARARKMNLSAEQKQTVENARIFVRGLLDDGSHGMHNPKPVRHGLKEFRKKLDAIAPPPNAPSAQ